jgi:hypothetical protein
VRESSAPACDDKCTACSRWLTAVWLDGLVFSEERRLSIEDLLRERLKKVEALYFGATADGERGAAGAAVERLKAKTAARCPRFPPQL